MLGRFFKPRWQHQDAGIRSEAVSRLDPNDPEHREILSTLARGDKDGGVRAMAAGRLTDLKQLGGIVEQDADPAVREAATQQVERLLAGLEANGPGLENRLRLIQLTDNHRALAFIATESPDRECRLAAVERLGDQEKLLALALDGPEEAVRARAAERIENPELLKRLVRDGRDKRVLRAARERLKAWQAFRQEQDEQQQELDNLERQLRQHAGHVVDKLYVPKLQQLEQQWARLRDGADSQQKDRLEALLAQCRDIADHWQQQQEAGKRREESAAEQKACVRMLESLLDDIVEDTWEAGIGSLRAALGTQERRWQTACEALSPPTELAGRFDRAHASLQAMLDTFNRLNEQRETLDALLQRADEGMDESLRDEIRTALPDWPGPAPAPTLIRKLSEVAGQPMAEPVAQPRAKAERNEDAHRVLGALARELRKRNLRHANRLWRKAETLLEEHPDGGASRRMKKMRADLEELRDWHAFAAEPKKSELCERMETLAEQEMDPEEKATAIQALHDEWRDLMSSDQDRDQALWDRFKAASDRAYEPCREHFRELDRERADNLARREALCRQLEEFVANENWDNADWHAVWEIRQRAPEEWKQYQPVRFTDAREVQKRFSGLLSRLDERLREATDAHRPIRDRLLDRLEELANGDDPEAAAREAREIQQEWKQTPWVHPNVHRGMHRRLRRLCDRIFGARDDQRNERREQARASAESAQTELDALEPLLKAGPGSVDLAAAQNHADRLRDIHIPRSDAGLHERRDKALAALRRLRDAAPRWRRWHSLLERIESAGDGESTAETRTLAVALEVLAGTESPDHAREERMAWQLEQLPQAMTSGKGGDTLDEVEKQVEATPLDSVAPELRERMIKALRELEPGRA